MEAIDRAAWLSQFSKVGGRLRIPITFNKDVSQVISQAVRAMTLYSDSAVERATSDCFLIFHDMGELPRRMQNPLVDFLVVGQLAQSESQ